MSAVAIVIASLSAADAFGLLISALVCAYLIYALLRGERL